jgi:hypothetical protein
MSVTTPILSADAEAAGDGLAATDGAAEAAMDGSTEGTAADAAGVGVAEPLHADATIASVATSRPSRLVRVIMNSSLRELNLERGAVGAIARRGRAGCVTHRTERPVAGQDAWHRVICRVEE